MSAGGQLCGVWTYWEGERPSYIDLCLRSMSKTANGRLTILTPENLGEVLPKEDFRDYWDNLGSPAIRSCCIRAAVLARYGGWWFDADTVLLREPPRRIERFTFTRWKRRMVVNGYLGATLGSEVCRTWLGMIDQVMRAPHTNRADPGWGNLGEVLLTPAVLIHGGEKVLRRYFLPVDFDLHPRALVDWTMPIGDLVKESLTFALNNSWLREHAPEYLEPPWDGSSVLHQALRRAKEILA